MDLGLSFFGGEYQREMLLETFWEEVSDIFFLSAWISTPCSLALKICDLFHTVFKKNPV